MSKFKLSLLSSMGALALEPRLLFDGAGGVGVADAMGDDYAQPEQSSNESGQNDADTNAILNGDDLHVPGDASPSVLVIIDSRVDDFQSLLADLPANTVVRVVDSEESGLAAISDELAKGGNFDAVHIFSHGTPGSFTLGSDQVDSSTLDNQAQQLQSWAGSLTEEADILLYGCDIAQGEAGQTFITQLAALTGADIAASTNATGAADQGGDWVLESETGSIEAQGFEFGVYGGLLGEVGNGSISNVTNTADDLVVTVGEDDEPTAVLDKWEIKGNGQIKVELSGAANGTLTGGTSFTGTAEQVNTWLKTIQYQYKTTDQSQIGDTDSITLTFTTYSGATPTVRPETQTIKIAPQNDAPTVPTGTHTASGLKVNEGGTLAFGKHTGDELGFTHSLLNISDPDNLAEQVIIKLTTIPDKADGKFVLKGVTLEAGSSFSVADLEHLTFVHSGKQVLTADTSVSFIYTIDDGAGGRIEGNEVAIKLVPVNQTPSISGSVTIIQGEGAVSIGGVIGSNNLPVLGGGNIDRGKIEGNDPDDDVLTYKITSLPSVGQLVYDGVELTAANIGSVAITDLSKLTYAYPKDLEPKDLGAEPVVTFTMKATDQGGGTEVSAESGELTVNLTILDNNNDPVIDKNIAQDYKALAEAGKVTGNSFVVTTEMLNVTDPDSFDKNIIFNITSKVDANAGGYFTLIDQLLDEGTAFSLDDLQEGKVKYHLRTQPGDVDRDDSFTFTVTDSGKGIVFPEGGTPFARDGGIYDSDAENAALVEHTFTVTVPHTVGTGAGGDLPGLPPKATGIKIGGGMKMDGVLESQGTADGSTGVPITKDMLDTTDHTDSTKATPPEGIVYRIETVPSSGSIWLDSKQLKQFDSFTQADINTNKVEFRHDGGEQFTDQLVFSVSNGTTTTAVTGELDITIVPQNDTPEASQVGDINLLEGTTITITGAHIGLSDRDIAAAAGGYANINKLWFVITELPNTVPDPDSIFTGEGTKPTVVGKLQWKNDSDVWEDITGINKGGANGDGKITINDLNAGRLQYVHNGTEDFADSFKIIPYDNQDVTADPAAPTNQSSQGTEVKIDITVAPVNNAPVLQESGKVELTGALALYEGQSAIIGGNGATAEQGQLVFNDQDNSKVQNQFRVTTATQYGTLTKDGVALKVGSIFTQKDLDEGKIKYVHNGSDTRADKFEYTVSDGDFTVNDKGVIGDEIDGVDNVGSSVFNIEIKPTNDKPEFAAKPSQPVIVDGVNSSHNIVNGFQVKDIDLVTVDSGEVDLITVIVRVVDSSGIMLAGTDYSLSVDSSGVTGTTTTTNTDRYLQLTGTVANVNAALTTLGVGFSTDINDKGNYKLQVIVDDRINADKDGYQNGGAGVSANGGDKNQNLPERSDVDATEYDWTTAVITATTSLNLNVAEVDLWVSPVNHPAKIDTVPGPIIVNEDVPFKISGFVFSDPESTAFGTSVEVTLSVGSGTLEAKNLPAGVTVVSGDKTGTLKLSGSVEKLNAYLGSAGADTVGVFYTTAKDVNHDTKVGEDGDVTLTVTLSEGDAIHNNPSTGGSAIGGDVGLGSVPNIDVTSTVAITINAVNDAPTVAAGSGLLVLESDAATAVTGVVITDKDIRGDDASNGANDLDIHDGEIDFIQVTVRLQQQNGANWQALAEGQYKEGVVDVVTFGSTATSAGVTIHKDGAGDVLVVSGTLDNVNAYLSGLTVQIGGDLANQDKPYRIQVIADDRLRDGGGTLTGSANGGNNPDGTVPSTVIDPYATAIDSGLSNNVASAYREVFPSAVNDPATIEGAITEAKENSNGSVTLKGLEIKDSDALDKQLEVTVTLPNDFKIHSIGGTGGTISVDAVGSNEVTITGTLTEINARLNAIQVTLPDLTGNPDSTDWNGTFDVKIKVDDLGNSGSRPTTLEPGDNADGGTHSYFDPAGGSTNNRLITERTLEFKVTPHNDAPVVTDAPVGGVELESVAEDIVSGDNAGKKVSDLFGDYFDDSKDQIDHTEDNGKKDGSNKDEFFGVAIVGLTPNAEQGAWQYHDGTAWVDIGERTESTVLVLDKDTQIRFQPKADFHGTPNQLTVRLVETDANNDRTGDLPTHKAEVNLVTNTTGGSTVYSAGTINLKTEITPVNDAPSFTGDLVRETNEDTTSTSIPVSEIAAGLTFSDSTDNKSTVTGGGNTETADAKAIAIVGNAATAEQGTWYYTTNGSDWQEIPTGASVSEAILLDPANTNHQVRFVPAENYNGEVGKLTVRAADDTYTGGLTGGSIDLTGVTGTTHPWSANSGTVTITVKPVNDPPGLTATGTTTATEIDGVSGSAASIESPLFVASTVTVSDPDLGTGDVTAGVFGAGTITVTLGANKIAGDSLEIATGLDGFASSSVDANGVLTITLMPNATVEQVEKIIEAIKFVHKGDDPTNITGAGTERSSIGFTVVLNDGNNVQVAGDAGGPNGLEATLSGIINIVAKNDPPVANNDTNGLKNSVTSPIVGNVIKGKHTDGTGDESTNGTDTDPDTKLEDLKITEIQKLGDGGSKLLVTTGDTIITGQYGTLTIKSDGSYSYELDQENAAVYGLAKDATLSEDFTYMLSDGDKTDTANLVITITGDTPPALGIEFEDHNGATGGHATVHESGLPAGSEPSSNKHVFENGKIKVTSPSGLVDIKVGDGSGAKTFNAAQLQAASPTNPLTVNTPYGVLTITNATVTGDPSAPKSVELTYTYKLSEQADNSADPDKEGRSDTIALVVTDKAGSANGSLEIYIVDDQPIATADVDVVDAEKTLVVSAGNGVLKNDNPGADDWAAGGGVIGVVHGTNNTPSYTGTGTELQGAYGKLTLNPDGSYTYLADPAALNADPTVEDVFTYTVRDGDGDETTTTLTITVRNNLPPAAEDDSASTIEDTPVSGNLLTNDSDPDGDPITVTEITVGGKTTTIPTDGSSVTIEVPGKGKITVNKNGGYTFTPNPGVIGNMPEIDYKISDGKGGEDDATLRINVKPGNPHIVAPPAPGNPNTGNHSPLSGPPGLTSMKGIGDSSVITDPSVFYEGERHDDVRRLPIPLHPIVYVNNQVNVSQELRSAEDLRANASPSLVQPAQQQSVSLAMGLGQDHNLFVSHAIKAAQQSAEILDLRVSGRLGRTSLSADGLLYTPSLHSDIPGQATPTPAADQETTSQAPGQPAAQPSDINPDDATPDDNENEADDLALMLDQGFLQPESSGQQGRAPIQVASRSFSQQLRAGGNRLPMAKRDGIDI